MGASFDQYSYYGALDATVGGDIYAGFHTYGDDYITAFQFNPWIRHSFKSAIIPGTFTVSSKGRIQHLSEDLGHGTILSGAEIGISDYFYPYTISAKLWTGSSQFGVYEDGFAVYNNTDLMTTGFASSFKYHFTHNLSFLLSYQYYTLYLEGSSTRGNLQKIIGMFNLSL